MWSVSRTPWFVLPPAQLLGDLDTTTGALALTGVARKSVYTKARGLAALPGRRLADCIVCVPPAPGVSCPTQDSLLTRVDLDTTITSDGRVTYGVAGHSAVDLTSDGLLALEARLGCTLPSNAFASAWGRRHGSGVYATVSGARAAKRAGRAGGGSGGDGGSLDFGGVAKALGNALVPEGNVAVSQVFLNFNVRARMLPGSSTLLTLPCMIHRASRTSSSRPATTSPHGNPSWRSRRTPGRYAACGPQVHACP